FRPFDNPMEILQATVEEGTSVRWNGEQHSALLVVYRVDSGSGTHSDQRGRMWVRSDGLVLKQEVTLFNSHLLFVRLPDGLGTQLVEELGPECAGQLDRELARQWTRKFGDPDP